MQLTVNTSFWTRYRSDSLNPDFGDTLPQAIPTLGVNQHTAIPRTDADTTDPNFLQAIANTAGFHFSTIVQGGERLFPPLAQKATGVGGVSVILGVVATKNQHFLNL